MRARGGAPDGAQGSGARWLLEQLRTGCAHGSAPLRRQAERALMELLSALATAEVQARAEAARGAGAGCPSELRARRRGICHLTLGIGSRKALGSSPDRGGCAVHLAGPSARRHQTQAASSTRRVAAGQGCRSAPADGRRQVGDLSFERAPLSRRRTGRRAAARADRSMVEHVLPEGVGSAATFPSAVGRTHALRKSGSSIVAIDEAHKALPEALNPSECRALAASPAWVRGAARRPSCWRRP